MVAHRGYQLVLRTPAVPSNTTNAPLAGLLWCKQPKKDAHQSARHLQKHKQNAHSAHSTRSRRSTRSAPVARGLAQPGRPHDQPGLQGHLLGHLRAEQTNTRAACGAGGCASRVQCGWVGGWKRRGFTTLWAGGRAGEEWGHRLTKQLHDVLNTPSMLSVPGTWLSMPSAPHTLAEPLRPNSNRMRCSTSTGGRRDSRTVLVAVTWWRTKENAG